jgi:hypothetical protein
LFGVLLSAGAILAFPDWQKSDPSQWTSDDVYRILNNSPWSKPSKIKVSDQSSGGYGDQTSQGSSNPNGTWGNGGQMPPGTGGGMGRRGMGGGGYGGAGRGGGGSRPSSTPKSQPVEVTVQWQSALPVRLAAAKKSGSSVDIGDLKPLDNYVIAVIGLPMRYIGGRSASSDSAETNTSVDERRLEDHLKSATSLLCSGRESLSPTKVEVNQGADGRILFYFPKTQPITAKDKSVEFRIAMESMDLRKKFTLKDMEFKEKLDL